MSSPDRDYAAPPVIGVSVSMHDFGDYGGVGVQRPLYAAGGLPVMLPQLPETIAAVLDRLDAWYWRPGATSIQPDTGRSRTRCWPPIEPQRDEFEFALAVAAIAARPADARHLPGHAGAERRARRDDGAGRAPARRVA